VCWGFLPPVKLECQLIYIQCWSHIKKISYIASKTRRVVPFVPFFPLWIQSVLCGEIGSCGLNKYLLVHLAKLLPIWWLKLYDALTLTLHNHLKLCDTVALTLHNHLKLCDTVALTLHNHLKLCDTVALTLHNHTIKKWVKDRKGLVAYVYQISWGCDVTKMFWKFPTFDH
jgi:hypothetical protein